MSARIRSLLQGSPLPMPVSPQDIYRQQGSASMPGTDAAAEAGEQNSADWQRYLDTREQQRAETPRGMGISERQARHAADMKAADYGPMDGSKPPAEAFLPASKPSPIERGPAPVAKGKAPVQRGPVESGEGGGYEKVASSPDGRARAVAEKVVAEQQASPEEGSRQRYEDYVRNEKARAGRLKELGMMHENQETVLPYEDWMDSQSKSTGPIDMSAETAAAVAENKEKFPNWQSNPKYARRVSAGQRRSYMNRVAKQYASQIAENPQLLDAIMAEYDSGASTSQMPSQEDFDEAVANGTADSIARPQTHGLGAASARNITDKLDARDLAQRQLNVKAGWDQINQGRMHGVPRGFIAAQQEINNAMASGDSARAAAVAATYSRIYGPQFLAFAASTNQRLGQEAEARAQVMARQKTPDPTPMAQWSADNKAISQMEPGARLAAMRAQASMGGAEGEAVDAQVQASMQPHLQKLVSKPPQSWTPEERTEFMQVMNGMDYEEFATYLGLPNDETTRKFYQDMTGNDARGLAGHVWNDGIGTGIYNWWNGVST